MPSKPINMFGLLSDIVKGAASVVGVVVGSVLGVSVTVIAATLGITVIMVSEAMDAGCTTYEEIRDFHGLE